MTVKNSLAMWEMWVRSLGGEGPMEKEMKTHASILGLKKFYGQRSLMGYHPWSHRVGHDLATTTNKLEA